MSAAAFNNGNRVHVHEVGVVFTLTFVDGEDEAVDLTDATELELLLEGPTGATNPIDLMALAPFEDAAGGIVEYVSAASDLDTPGRWRFQGRAVTSAGEYRTDPMVGFNVHKKGVTVPGVTPSTYGPQASIACPIGAVSIPAGSTTASRQTLIDNNPAGTAFCLAAGVHLASGANTPKSGNTFAGQFGAVIDGTGWSSVDPDAAAFKALNTDVDNVVFRNLVMRNMPIYAINAYNGPTAWIIEYCEIYNTRNSIGVTSDSIVRYNKIHDNIGANPAAADPNERGGGYIAFQQNNILFLDNEFYGNGAEQKLGLCTNCTFRGNYFHGNHRNGIWLDSTGTGSLIENNRCDDHANGAGIVVELCGQVLIRSNRVKANQQGIYVTLCHDIEAHGNTVEHNTVSGLEYFVDLDVVAGSDDLTNNSFHHNIVRAIAPAWGAVFTHTGAGVSATPYDTNTKRNLFDFNTYYVNNLSGNLFHWAGNKTWTQWRAVPQDAGSTIAIG